MYYIIHCSEDGEISVSEFTEEKLLVELNDDYWGTNGFIEKIDSDNPQEWDADKLLIIKGEIIKPKPKKIVDTYEL